MPPLPRLGTTLTSAAGRSPMAPSLTGTPATAPWDPDLRAALSELGVRIEEETVLDDLLTDLAP
ncbi:DUF2399 domain-containing protein [Streptomyces malaysiensis subsp. malaysiensis]|uniref:DUF2399 domain-containing protein n=1 Tax=Streptomyces malaysiensis TaxID=92644 RepID=UPI0024BF41AD|nr:DUF2399 domain-containing protein [Streptomyces sp. NA07423]WHX18589.1 DUF2399 domain-containing protein [Streptomyces sp. NA07423]